MTPDEHRQCHAAQECEPNCRCPDCRAETQDREMDKRIEADREADRWRGGGDENRDK